MGRVYECIGQKANRPFYLEKIRCNIFSAEELVYCVYQHAELIECDMFTPELASWLERECGAVKIAKKLTELVTKKASLTAYIETLLQEMDLVEAGKKREFLEIFCDDGVGDILHKKKKRADYFLKKERFFHALKEYILLLQDADAADDFFRAEIYHNMGIAKANLFLFEEAQNDFYKAYRLDGKEEHFYLYAAAMRMRLSRTEYIQEISEVAHMKDVMLKLEEDVSAAEFAWKENRGSIFEQDKTEHLQKGNASYEKWLASTLSSCKNDYKKSAR